MQKINTKKILFAFLSLFHYFPLSACAGETHKHSTANDISLAPLVQQLSDLFFIGKLSVSNLEKKLSPTAEQAENKKYWSIDSDKYNVRTTVKANNNKSAVEELQLYTNELKQLELKDLEILYRESQVFVPSKSPWVKFTNNKSQDGKIS